MEGERRARIGLLRVRGAGRDALAARLRAESVLATVAWNPPGLPPSAYLIVRRLGDPLPRRVALHGAHVSAPMAWRRSVEGELERLWREAARPADGMVPAGCEAVRFDARGELLACLARDWCRGTLAVAWWWRELLRYPANLAQVLEYWLAGPEFVPAALEILHRTDAAVRFLAAWPPDMVERALDAVIVGHGLGYLHARSELLKSPIAAKAKPLRRAGCPVRPVALGQEVAEAPQFPFIVWPAGERLYGAAAALLDLALALQQAPRRARAPEYADALVMAIREGRSPQVSRPEPGGTGPAEPEMARKFRGSTKPATTPSAWPAGGWARAGAGRDSAAMSPAPPAAVDTKKLVLPVLPVLPGRPGAQGESGTAIMPGMQRAEHGAALALGPASADTAPVSPAWNDLQPPQAISRTLVSELGGAFYLVNLGLFLGLYGDFTQPLRPGIALPVWDFVELVAKRLLRRCRIPSDPLWALLAELSGRHPRERAGQDFQPVDDWRMPAAWLAPFTEACPWRASRCGARLRVVHPAGFAVLDIACAERDWAGRLRSEMLAYPAGRCRVVTRQSAGTERCSANSVRRWLDRLLPYVRARLALALGCGPRRNLGRLVCRQRARIELGPSQLDVHFSLAQLPIEIRCAGLDRDPGWVPAAGRYLRFHFH